MPVAVHEDVVIHELSICATFFHRKHLGNAMNLLITNDDGYDAPGIQLLASVAAKFGDVTIVAPANQQSGISHQITFEQPLSFEQRSDAGYTVDGTPADCVRVAVSLWKSRFDYVLSGVNDGANLGVDVMYSGTVGAAREATFFGIPAIALSQYRANYSTSDSFDFEKTRPLLESLLSDLLSRPDRNAMVTNVNLPDRAASVPQTQIDRINCKVDPSPLPADFENTESGLLYTGKYIDRPRKKGMDLSLIHI